MDVTSMPTLSPQNPTIPIPKTIAAKHGKNVGMNISDQAD
jgi:hypothetical protein